jgi:hypothetical protein
MAEEKQQDQNQNGQGGGRSKDEVALDMMKFIAVTTGYGKGPAQTGFGGKSTVKSPEDYAESLLQLFERCREVIAK